MLHEARFLADLDHRFLPSHLIQMTGQVFNGFTHPILPLRYILEQFSLGGMRVLRGSLFLCVVNHHTPGHFTAIGVSGAGLGCDVGEGRAIGLILEVAGLERKAVVIGQWVRIRVIIWFGKVGFERKIGVAGIVF